MRCIEIITRRKAKISNIKINRNMRCIEIDEGLGETIEKIRINRNMRCIEILFALQRIKLNL